LVVRWVCLVWRLGTLVMVRAAEAAKVADLLVGGRAGWCWMAVAVIR
jgi:hypothetical protein